MLQRRQICVRNIKNISFTKNMSDGVGEMAQWLRTLAALAEDLSSVPSTYMVAHNLP